MGEIRPWAARVKTPLAASVIVNEATISAAAALARTAKNQEVRGLEDIEKYAAETGKPDFFQSYVACRIIAAMSNGKIVAGVNDEMASYIESVIDGALEDQNCYEESGSPVKIKMAATIMKAVDQAIDAIIEQKGLGSIIGGPSGN